MELKDRLKAAIESSPYRGNQSDLAKAMGIKPQSVQAWLSGKSKPKFDNLERIASLTGTPLTTLMGTTKKQAVNASEIPFYTWNEATKFTGTITEPKHFINSPAKSLNDGFAVQFAGDSMTSNGSSNSIYKDGSILFFQTCNSESSGDKVLITVHDDTPYTVFKTLVIDAGKTWLKSANPEYPAIEITGLKTTIHGKLTASINFE